MPMNMAPVDRLQRRMAINENGCWVWGQWLDPNGYGEIRVDGKKWKAHCLSYVLFVGPIPDGLILDHLCRNRACINPDHLEPVTRGENVLRGEHPNVVLHRAGVCKRGHALTDDNTSWRSDGRRRCRACVNEGERRRRANAGIARDADHWDASQPEK